MADEATNDVTNPAQPTAPAAPVSLNINAAPATPAAPAAPAEIKPADVKVPEPTADDGVKPYEYAEVPDDPGLNYALKFVGKLGYSPDHPAMQAALKSGDFALLEAELAQKGDKAKGFEQVLKLARQSWDREVARAGAEAKATTDAVMSVVGGPEQWGEIRDWAGKNAEPHEKETINKMLNSGDPFMAKMAAQFLQASYAQSQGAVIEPKEAAAVRPANSASSAQGALSPEQFQAEIGKLMKTYGSNIGDRPEYKALVTRRTAYRGN